MADQPPWTLEIARQAGLVMTPERAAGVAAEAARIRAGVAAAVAPKFGFHDEPLHFLTALEDCAEPEVDGDGEAGA